MGSSQDGRLTDVSSDSSDCSTKQKATVSRDFPSGFGPDVLYVNQPQWSEPLAPPEENANMGDDKASTAVGVSASGNTSQLVNISVLQQLVKNLVKSELTGSLDALVGKVVTATCKDNGIELSLLLEPKTLEPKSLDELPEIENQATVISDIGSTSDGTMLNAKQCGPLEDPVNKITKGIVGTHSTNEKKILGDYRTNKPEGRTPIEFPRRRVSVVREYPPFCGRNAPCPTKEERLRINLGNQARSEEVNGVAGRAVLFKNRKFEDMGRPLKQTTADLQNHLIRGKASSALLENKGRGQVVNDVEARDGLSKKRKLEELGSATAAHSGNSSFGVRATESNFVSKTTPSTIGVKNARDKVLETLALSRAICEELEARKVGRHENVIRRVDLEAVKIIRERGKEVNTHKQWIGSVPGIEVGDEFLYRVELVSVGIHRQYQGGIDYIKDGSKIIATSIIASEGGYSDDRADPEVLIYSGQGGNITGRNDEPPKDQKLEKGNLALKNSIMARTPVRVTRGFKTTETSRRNRVVTYTYDGLYMVEKYWRDVGQHGKVVYMFELKRVPGQPKVAWKTPEMNMN